MLGDRTHASFEASSPGELATSGEPWPNELGAEMLASGQSARASADLSSARTPLEHLYQVSG